ncbi:MAG TPA: hypothetical protein VJK08_01415 [Patescibacteria group bacterium]|nr:hypothetical protein [Patescibacteria group bacterium]
MLENRGNMALDKNDLKKIETELAVLKERFSRASERIGKTGGKKNSAWCFWLKHRIYDIEEKIDDLKTDTIRTDKLLPAEMEIEKKVALIETKLGLGKK